GGSGGPWGGETRDVLWRGPSPFGGGSRWRPFGVQKPPVAPRTTMIGSRNEAASSIFTASRFACVGERSRWNGVGSTASRGSEATSKGLPESGSRYAPIGAPP